MANLLHFREYEIDLDERTLRRSGDPNPIAISRLLLELLSYLARTPGRVVSKEELVEEVWKRTVVSDQAVARAVADLRRAIGDDGRSQDLIRTIHGVGYSFVGDVEDFVGRLQPMGVLRRAATEAGNGSGGVVFVSGEPGIGKTRLVEETCRHAAVDGMDVLWGNASEDEGAPALWPWPDLLRTLVEERGSGLLERSLGDSPETLRGLLSAPNASGRRRRRTGASDGQVGAAEARFRMFDAAVRVVREASRRRPLIIVLEDLHWASSTSVALLRFMASSLQDAGLLLLCTYRSSGATLTQELRAALGEMSALRRSRLVELEGLGVDEVARLAWRASGIKPSPELARAIHARTAGNPLFVRELARDLPRESNWDGGDAEGLDRLAVPQTVQKIVQTRTARLSPSVRSVIRAVAVFGTPVSLAVLRQVTDLPGDVLISLLEEANDAGLLSPTKQQNWRFSHPLVRSSIYEGLSGRERMDLHLRAGKAIESVRGLDSGPHAAEVAFHFVAALPESDAHLAARYCRRAGEDAQARGAFEEAARHFDRAGYAYDFAESVDPGDRCDVLLALAESRRCAGQGEVDAIRRAAEVAHEMGDPSRLGRCALAMGALAGPLLPMHEIADLTERALAHIDPGSGPLHLLLLAQLAAVEKFAHREKRAKRLLEDVLQAARRVEVIEIRCEILLRHLQILQGGVGGDPENRLPLADDILVQASQVGRADLVLESRRHRVALLLEQGDGSALDREIAAFQIEAARSRRFDMRHHAAACRAMRALHRGVVDEAQARMEEATRYANPLDRTQTLFTPITQRTLLPHDESSMRDLLSDVEKIIAAHPEVVGWRAARMNIAVALADRDDAARTLAFFARDRFDSVGRDLNRIPVLVFCASAATWLGDREKSEILYENLRPFSRYNVILGWGAGCYGPVAHYLGLLAATLGHREKAFEHYESAIELSDRSGAVPWRIRTLIARARLLAGSESPGDQRRSREQAKEASTLATERGLVLDAVEAAGIAEASARP